MLDRHLLRSIVLQSLFEWDSRLDDHQEGMEEILLKNIEEFAGVKEIPPFAKKIYLGILEKKEDIDNIIQKAAPQWPLDKIPTIDRNILRIGICELIYSDRMEVPPKVAINEAIELSKAFGGESSSKFISGVMGTIYKELGEPQKHETSESHRKKIDEKNLPTKTLGGAMVYAVEDGRVFVVMAHNIFGYWALIKGKTEEGESSKDAAVRKVREKAGIDISIEDKIDTHEYTTFHTEEGRVKRATTFYLARSFFSDLELDKGGEGSRVVDGVRWFPIEEIDKLDIYDDLKPVIEKGKEMIKNKLNK